MFANNLMEMLAKLPFYILATIVFRFVFVVCK